MKQYIVGVNTYHSDQFNETPMMVWLKDRHGATLAESLGQRFWTIQSDEKLGDLAHLLAMTLCIQDRGLVAPFQAIDPVGNKAGLQKAIEEAIAGKEWFDGGLQNA